MTPTAPWSRGVAAAGAAFAAWIAADALLSSGLISGPASDAAFFWFWGMPFAAVACFLGWYALTGARPGPRALARRGCLGGLVTGGAAFLVLGVLTLLRSRGVLDAAVNGLRYAPVAAVLGLAVFTVVNTKGSRRSR